MELSEIRKNIDKVDTKLFELFEERMKLAECVARTKKSTGDCIYKPDRELQVISKFSEPADEDMKGYYEALIKRVMLISREYQYRILNEDTPADTEAAMLSAGTVTVRFTYKGFPDNIVTAINDSGAKITGFTMNNSEYSISIRHDSCKTGIINLLKMIESESDNYSILVPEISVSDIPK
ncbi:MAG: chorismate mutase [Lachnospiraceae bacterium]|nr:chorismate mutase [Lachnoclostridium sp.]MDD7521683.1 chorismate mutase [Lachnoclostridium sp.]MDY2599828.1 chorismate mutase [Lachnospiraceae bacterium]